MKLSGAMIHGKQLSIGYQNGKQIKYVHRNLNFELRQGELTCLLGANGAGNPLCSVRWLQLSLRLREH